MNSEVHLRKRASEDQDHRGNQTGDRQLERSKPTEKCSQHVSTGRTGKLYQGL
jgi:hypothetical protein